MAYRIVFDRQAREDLRQTYDFIRERTGSAISRAYIRRVMRYIEGFSNFPARGQSRDDLRPGLRLVGFQRQATIAFVIDGDDVIILRIFFRGRKVDFS